MQKSYYNITPQTVTSVSLSYNKRAKHFKYNAARKKGFLCSAKPEHWTFAWESAEYTAEWLKSGKLMGINFVIAGNQVQFPICVTVNFVDGTKMHKEFADDLEAATKYLDTILGKVPETELIISDHSKNK